MSFVPDVIDDAMSYIELQREPLVKLEARKAVLASNRRWYNSTAVDRRLTVLNEVIAAKKRRGV